MFHLINSDVAFWLGTGVHMCTLCTYIPCCQNAFVLHIFTKDSHQKTEKYFCKWTIWTAHDVDRKVRRKRQRMREELHSCGSMALLSWAHRYSWLGAVALYLIITSLTLSIFQDSPGRDCILKCHVVWIWINWIIELYVLDVFVICQVSKIVWK